MAATVDGFDEPVKPSMPPPSGRGASPRKSALKISAGSLFPQVPEPPSPSSPTSGKSALKNASSADGLAAPINGSTRNNSKQPALNQISEGTNDLVVRPPSDPSPCAASPKTRGVRKKKEDQFSDDGSSCLSGEETPAGLPSNCFNCGNVMLSDSNYCRNCGTRRSLHGAKNITLMAEEVKCSCGSIFASDSVFCRRCGRPRPGHEEEAESSRRPSAVSAVVEQVVTSLPFQDLPNVPREAAKALLRRAYKSIGRSWQTWLWTQAEASPESQAIDSIATWTFNTGLSEEQPASTGSTCDPALSCTGCGNKFLCDSLFCRKCGQERPGGKQHIEQANLSSVCLVCGNEFMPDAKFCRRCGTQRQEQAWRKKSRRTVAFSSNMAQDRQTCFILRMDTKDDCHGDHKAEGTANKSDAVQASAPEAKTPVAESPPVARVPNPLKEVMMEKKVKIEKVRAQLTSIPDAAKWLELPLESGHPFVERPLVHAVASIDAALVALLLEFKAEHSGPYNGEKMYKGWIKPGSTLIESVQSRKGRFVGTMLGDKLSKIETLLTEAQAAAAPAEEAANPAEPSPAADTSGAADSAASADAAAADAKPAADAPETTESRKKLASDFVSADVDDNAVAEMGRKSQNRNKQLRTSVVVRTALGHLHTIGHPQDAYEIQKQVDDGDTSSIWLGVHKETTKAIAIKVELKYDEGLLWEEIAVLNQLSHPNVISLHETFETPDQLYCVLDLCQGGRLFEAFSGNCEIGVQNLHALKRLMKQQVLAVRHIHEHCVCHRDIQLDNFLFVESCPLTNLELATVKLIDFTTSKRFGIGFDPMKTKICTPAYCAWEICQRGEMPYTEKIDIWSLGVVFFIMLCGRQPFPGSNDFEVLKKIKKAAFSFEPTDVWKQVPDDGHDIINKMIKKPADERLSANQLLEHIFLRPPVPPG